MLRSKTFYYLDCDLRTCTAVTDDHDSQAEAENQAVARGWVVDKHVTLCPKHKGMSYVEAVEVGESVRRPGAEADCG